MRGMKATFLPKKSKRQNLPTKPQTPEEEVAAEEERKARIKAANYSLACSCRCNGINFFDYLSDVLNKAADLQHLTPEAYRNLLPDRWTKE